VSVESSSFNTQRGDSLVLSLFMHAGEDPSILLTVMDSNETMVPTAEFTVAEAAELREQIRKYCERAARRGR
jgi:hypothetical protein